MKQQRILRPHLLLLCLLFLAATVQANEPDFKAGVRLQDSAGDMKPGMIGQSASFVVDWNEDGMKDLLVGAVGIPPMGHLYLYLNSGTDTAPVFTDFSTIQADGMDISTPFG